MNPPGELTTVERVAALHRVDMFATVPGHLLVGLARLAEEVSVRPGATFIERAPSRTGCSSS